MILERLRSAEVALRARGVNHAALFGSVARGDAGSISDIDILVDLNPTIVRTMFDYAGIKSYIVEMFDGAVDVVDREGLKSMSGRRRSPMPSLHSDSDSTGSSR